MRFDTSQQMRMGQHMKLAPRMIQSMEILQMPLMELEERISQELESNATLEVAEPGEIAGADEGKGEAESRGDSGAEGELRVDEGGGKDDFDRLDSFEESTPEIAEEYGERGESSRAESLDFERLTRTRLEGEPDAKSEAMANTAARSASLVEQLRDQWALSEVDESLRPLGEQIISFIDDDGYLRTPLETIADRLPAGSPGAGEKRPDIGALEKALGAVQLLLEPPGVAARDLRECLLLQVDALMDEARGDVERTKWETVRRLIAEHLEDLAQNRLPKVVERTGLSMDELKRAMEEMRRLSLAPARALVEEKTGAIIPDAIVEYDADQDRYVAYLNDSRMPNLRINQEYARLAKGRDVPGQTREFIRKNLSNAQWLIEAVEQRKRTLLRVLNVVVDAQREWFDYGPQSLKPLPMTQVAEQLGVHVATVSRAVSDKYLLTPRGVVPLRGFFSGGMQTHSGEDVSWDAIKAALKEVIDSEDKSSPLSDDALAEELEKRGIEIARRTVAKYRDQLHIPPKRLRKQF